MDWYYTLSAFLAVFTTIAGVSGGLWSLHSALNNRVTEVQIESGDDLEKSERRMGEIMLSLRQKINETELWNRDNFVRRSDFTAIMEGVNRSIDNLSTRMEMALAKIDAKIDKLKESQNL